MDDVSRFRGVVEPMGVVPSSGSNGKRCRMAAAVAHRSHKPAQAGSTPAPANRSGPAMRSITKSCVPLTNNQVLGRELQDSRVASSLRCIPFPFIDASSSGRTRVSKTRDGSSTLSASVGWHTGKGHRKAPHAFFRRISGRSKAALKDPASGRFPFPERGGLVKGGMAPWRRPRTVSSHASAFQALGTMALRRTLDPLLGGSNPSAPKGRRRSGNRSSCPFKKDGRNPPADAHGRYGAMVKRSSQGLVTPQSRVRLSVAPQEKRKAGRVV